MKKMVLACCLMLSLGSSAFAAVSEQDKKNVNVALEKISKQAGRTFTAESIKETPVAGLLEVNIDSGIIYIYRDGRFAFSGEILDLNKDKDHWSLTEEAMRKERKKLLATISTKDMIIFPATKTKIGNVTVFTDIDCTYCRKLQANIKEYTDAGIEVRYVAFPRMGPGTPDFEKAITVWCSKDKARDYNLAAEGKDIPKNLCKNNPVTKQYELGQKIGVQGTPTMMLDDGNKIGGLIDAKELAKMIKG